MLLLLKEKMNNFYQLLHKHIISNSPETNTIIKCIHRVGRQDQEICSYVKSLYTQFMMGFSVLYHTPIYQGSDRSLFRFRFYKIYSQFKNTKYFVKSRVLNCTWQNLDQKIQQDITKLNQFVRHCKLSHTNMNCQQGA